MKALTKKLTAVESLIGKAHTHTKFAFDDLDWAINRVEDDRTRAALITAKKSVEIARKSAADAFNLLEEL